MRSYCGILIFLNASLLSSRLLEEVLDDIKPKEVWHYEYWITEVPFYPKLQILKIWERLIWNHNTYSSISLKGYLSVLVKNQITVTRNRISNFLNNSVELEKPKQRTHMLFIWQSKQASYERTVNTIIESIIILRSWLLINPFGNCKIF